MLTSPYLTPPYLVSPHFSSPYLPSPYFTSIIALTSSHLTSSDLNSVHPTSSHSPSPPLWPYGLTSSHLPAPQATLHLGLLSYSNYKIHNLWILLKQKANVSNLHVLFWHNFWYALLGKVLVHGNAGISRRLVGSKFMKLDWVISSYSFLL